MTDICENCRPLLDAITAERNASRKALIPWLLVAVADANHLDYITAAQRCVEMDGRLPR